MPLFYMRISWFQIVVERMSFTFQSINKKKSLHFSILFSNPPNTHRPIKSLMEIYVSLCAEPKCVIQKSLYQHPCI